MSYAQRVSVTVATAADGSATAYSDVLTGRVVNVIYTKDTYDDTVDFTITGESSGLSLWTESNVTASAIRSPVQAAHLNTSGAASAITQAPVHLSNERVKIALAQGGNVKSGTFTFILA